MRSREGQARSADPEGLELQVGLLVPEPLSTGRLCTGQVGYIISGMKTTKSARVGDTWHRYKRPVPPLPGFRPSKAMVFAGQACARRAASGRARVIAERLVVSSSEEQGEVLEPNSGQEHRDDCNASSPPQCRAPTAELCSISQECVGSGREQLARLTPY